MISIANKLALLVSFAAFPSIMGAVHPLAEMEWTEPFFEKVMSDVRDNAAFLVPERELYSDCSSCSFFNMYTGSCGVFSKETDKWCDDDFCCADSEDECCEPNPGAIVGVVLALIVLIAGIVVACCACCSCCLWHDKLCCAKKQNDADDVNANADSKPKESSLAAKA